MALTAATNARAGGVEALRAGAGERDDPR